MEDEVLDFISRRFDNNDCNWTEGNCYYFAIILKDRFPEGVIYYDVIEGHFLFFYKNNLYDYYGIQFAEGRTLIQWDKFDEYDTAVKKAVIKGCIL